MNALQNLQQDTADSETAVQTDSGESEPETRKRRRKFRPEEIAIACEIRDQAPVGEEIPFSELSIDAKRAVLPTSRMRLIEREIIEPKYNLDTGTVESVSINQERWEEYAEDLIPVAPKPTKVETPAQRKTRDILANEQYKIKKLADKNPRRENTHGWWNWETCYRDDISVVEYLNFLDYPRDIKVTSKRGVVNWFNGPAKIYVMQDLEAGNIGIYDSTLEPDAPGYWLTYKDVDTRGNAPETQPELEEADNGSESSDPAESEQPAV